MYGTYIENYEMSSNFLMIWIWIHIQYSAFSMYLVQKVE